MSDRRYKITKCTERESSLSFCYGFFFESMTLPCHRLYSAHCSVYTQCTVQYSDLIGCASIFEHECTDRFCIYLLFVHFVFTVRNAARHSWLEFNTHSGIIYMIICVLFDPAHSFINH